MTRAEFLTRLKRGLVGLPAGQIADIVADYEAHFNDAQEAGRSESEVAAALGDPERLAREQRAEQGVKRWEETKNPSAAAGAIFAFLGLGALKGWLLRAVLRWKALTPGKAFGRTPLVLGNEDWSAYARQRPARDAGTQCLRFPVA
jgi:hypothetical protein